MSWWKDLMNRFSRKRRPEPTPTPVPVPEPTPTPTPTPTPVPTPVPPPTGVSRYNTAVLADKPVLFLDGAVDLGSGKFIPVIKGGAAPSAVLPDGSPAWAFKSSAKQFLSIPDPSDGSLSIDKAGALTVELWLKLDNTKFPYPTPGLSGGLNLLGKSQWGGCEYEYRMYSSESSDSGNKPTDSCFYCFNPACGYGAGYDDHITPKQAGVWYFFAGVYSVSGSGLVAIHGGVFGSTQYVGQKLNSTTMIDSVKGAKITPKRTPTPFTIGSCGTGSDQGYLDGAIGKVAVFNAALTETQIKAHFKAMVAA